MALREFCGDKRLEGIDLNTCKEEVGDGINDAPAMAEADLSFAVGSSTDVAKRVGHIVLLRAFAKNTIQKAQFKGSF